MDSNLRIILDNAADRATVIASTSAGNLVPANMRTEIKSQVWRSVGTDAALTLLWNNPTAVSGAVLAFTNLTAASLIRARGYREHGDIEPLFDSGTLLAAPPAPMGHFPWGSPLGQHGYTRGTASLFTYGFGSYARVWFNGYAVKKLLINISDEENPDQHLEVSRLIVGPHWSPQHNFDYGHGISYEDQSRSTRSEAWDLRGEQGGRNRQISLHLSYLNQSDRSVLLHLLRTHGKNRPFFLSMFPESVSDPIAEQSYQLWCKISNNVKVTQPNSRFHASQLELEEM